MQWQKSAGISGLWVLNEIIQKRYPENMKKIVGAVWKLPAKGQLISKAIFVFLISSKKRTKKI